MFSFLIVLSIALSLLMGGSAGDNEKQLRDQPTIEAKAKGGGNKCPKIYAPVICDGGKVYPNQCVADRRNARNCVPCGLDCGDL